MYADFPFYQDFFKGFLITDEAMFRTFSERASEFVDTMTFDRLHDEKILDTYLLRVQKCICALTEQFLRRNMALSDFGKIPEISESIGAYSVSRANPYDYVQEISMTEYFLAAFRKSPIFLSETSMLLSFEMDLSCNCL